MSHPYGASARIFIGILSALAIALPGAAGAGTDDTMSEAAIIERIKPVGRVAVAGAADTAPPAPAAAAPAAQASPVEESVSATAQAAPLAEPVPATAEAAPAPDAGGEHPGKQLVNTLCAACHMTGVAGAPKLGDKAAWAARVANGLDASLQTAISGKGAMPPRGGNPNLSDDELRDAVKYMFEQVGS